MKLSFNQITKSFSLARVLTAGLVLSIIITAGLTYGIITNPDYFGFGTDAEFESTLLVVNLTLLLMVAFFISRKLIRLLVEREKGKIGSRLFLRLIFMFALVAVIPAIVVGFSSSFYLNLGIKSWFDARVSKAVVESVAVADAYLEEHKKSIKVEAQNLAGEITNNAYIFAFNKKSLSNYLTQEANRRFLAEAIVFQKNRVIAGSQFGLILNPWERYTSSDFEEAKAGEVIIVPEGEDKVSALVSLGGIETSYLMISRYLDPKVIAHTKEARGAAEEYLRLKKQINNFQIKSTWFFIIIALFVLLGAMWIAFRFANNIVTPVTNLVSATDRIKKGEFSVRVKEGPQNDEIATLSRSFNQMAAELENQKRGVIIANREATEKRQFSDAVLGGISSGVIALNQDKRIVLINSAAKEMLQLGDNSVNKYLREAIPEFYEVLEEAMEKPTKAITKQASVRRKTKRMNFNIRVNTQVESNVESYIITFDDLTELLSAQRMAAWSDVARKIAHEIKNPLTPINLSAQRLAKKYKNAVPAEDKENFEGYTSTIIRHTADIARIIGEFSDFAKLPAPKFAKADISTLLKDAVFSAKVANSKIDFVLDMPDEMLTIADSGQITQVLTNIIKNAAESVNESRKEGGKISATAKLGDFIEILIEDNGKGFPDELIDRLTEPYVTTREKGTGLGLAIVKKIIEDHQGKLELSNWRNGARVKIILPVL